MGNFDPMPTEGIRTPPHSAEYLSSIIAGDGISVDQATGAVTITNTRPGSGDLLAANNLSDVANAADALTNLGGAKSVDFNRDSRNNITVNSDINILADPSVATQAVTLTGAGGSSRNVVGSSTLTTVAAGTVASGVVMANRQYYVLGTVGTVTYNSVAYNPGDTFTGVFGIRTYVATGDCIVKNPISRLPDSAYINGRAYVATISGGYDHLNNQIAGTILGGGHNELRSGGNHATICGGSYHIQNAGLYSFIGGGTQNEQSQDFGFIGCGWSNTINSNNVLNCQFSAIMSGNDNRVIDASVGLICNGLNNGVINPSLLTPSACRHNTIINGTTNLLSGGIFGQILNGQSNTINGDSSFYCTIINGLTNTVSGTCSYLLVAGGSINITDLSRGIAYGTLLTMGAGTHNYLYGQSGELTGGQFNLSHGLSNNVTGTPTYCWTFGNANTETGVNTSLFVFGGTNTSAGCIYGGMVGFNNSLGASSNHSYLWGASNSSINGATYNFGFGLSHSFNGSDYGIAAGRSCTIADDATFDAATQAQYALAQGYQATARSFGQRAFSNGKENTTIEVQAGIYVAKRRYTHATGTLTTDLRLDGSGQYIRVPTNSVWTVKALVTAVLSDGSKYGSWEVVFAVRDTGGVLSILGSPTATVVFDGHSNTWTVVPAIRSSPRGITLTVGALNGETVVWGSTITTQEISTAW